MLQIVYTSTATRQLDSIELAALCDRSENNNRRDEVSGFLLIKSGKYLQVIEGPKEVVEDAFIRIIQDSRHTSVFVLSRRLTTRREFGQWEMACYRSLSEHDEYVVRIMQLTQSAPYPVQKMFADLVAENQ